MFNFDRAAQFYDNTRGFPAGEEIPIAQLLVRAGNLNTSSQILEVGIGTGRVAVPIAPYVKSIHGVDISARMMQKIYEKQPAGQIYPIQANAIELPYTNNCFDIVLLVHILHLVPDINQVIDEIDRVLKLDGKILNCWNSDDKTFQHLRKVWSIFSDTDTKQRWQQVTTIFDDRGWQRIPEKFTHTFIHKRVPAQFLEKFRNRVWSSTWKLTDEQIENAYQEMATIIKNSYDEPTKPINVSHTFHATVYTR